MFEYVLFEFVTPLIWSELLKTESLGSSIRVFIALAIMIMVYQQLYMLYKYGKQMCNFWGC